MGLDFSEDTYDGGLHLNLFGAEKCARYMGQILTEDCGLSSRRGEEKLEEEWKQKLQDYRDEISRQEQAWKGEKEDEKES